MSTIPGFTKIEYPHSCGLIKFCHRALDILSLALCKAAQHGHLSAKMAPLSLEIGHTSREIVDGSSLEAFWQSLTSLQPHVNHKQLSNERDRQSDAVPDEEHTITETGFEMEAIWYPNGNPQNTYRMIPSCRKYRPSQPLSEWSESHCVWRFQVSLSPPRLQWTNPIQVVKSTARFNDAIKPPSGHRTHRLALALVKYGKMYIEMNNVWSMNIFQQLLTSTFLYSEWLFTEVVGICPSGTHFEV